MGEKINNIIIIIIIITIIIMRTSAKQCRTVIYFHRVKNNIFLVFILTSFDFMTIWHSLLNLSNLLFSALVSY